MSNKVVLSIFLAVLFSSSIASAFDIAKILGSYPEYKEFNSLLNKTDLYKKIAERQSITVLVVKDDAMGDIAGRSLDVIKRVLSTHVILDYFDVPKITSLTTSITVTNLYQSLGTADGSQGFTNITATADKKVGFGSAVKGAPIDVKLQKHVMSQPYNISVLQVSGIIYTPGIDGSLAAPPRKAVSPAPAVTAPPPKKTTSSSSSSPTPSTSEDEVVEAPTVSTPAESPKAGAPKAADAPEADKVPADAKKKNSGVALCSGLLTTFVMALVSSFVAV